jgi:hypothetical protein
MKRLLEISLPIAQRTRSQNRTIVKAQREEKEWISATEFDSFCQNDPIIDWFSTVEKNTESSPIEGKVDKHPLAFLFEKGRIHEDNVVEALRKKTGFSLDKQSSLATSRLYTDGYDKKDIAHTRECMARGDYLIYSPYLSDHFNKIRGIPDLLIRNDYVPVLWPMLCVPKYKSKFGDYYYLPVEIKFSTINLAADRIHMLNSGRSKFYKLQLYTYCTLLEHIQDVKPDTAFIIGKRTVSKNKMNFSSLSSIIQPGVIHYGNYGNNNINNNNNENSYDESIPSLFEEGLEWLRRVKKYGTGWDQSIDNILKYNLFPNMKADHPLFQGDKKNIANTYGEITEIWQCGVKNRNNALSHGIYSWKDPNLSSSVMNVPLAYSDAIDKILKVNRGELGDYYPLRLTKNTNSFRDTQPEMFVDFETLRDSFDTSSYGEDEWIFLIGVYYKGEYKSFRLEDVSLEKEKEMIESFLTFWQKNGSPKCWFWYAEREFWRRALLRHPTLYMRSDINIKWVDLYQVVREEPFVVKGCKNFKLKSYVSSLSSLGKIKINPPPETCGNGLEAMTIAYQYYYEESDEKEENDKKEDRFKDIIKYNQFDCEALYQILTFLRTL